MACGGADTPRCHQRERGERYGKRDEYFELMEEEVEGRGIKEGGNRKMEEKKERGKVERRRGEYDKE